MTVTQCWDRLARMADLQDGWDSYGGAAPSPLARSNALSFCGEAVALGLEPDRVVASAMGGVAVCFYEDSDRDHKCYFEFYNNGTAHCLFYNERTDDETTHPVPTTSGDYRLLIERAKLYLTKTPSPNSEEDEEPISTHDLGENGAG